MSPEISLHGHHSQGHDDCPPVPVQAQNTSVRVGGKAVACVGDALQPHGCDDHKPHQGKISNGAPHVRIAGRQVARKGDAIHCGPAQDLLAEGAGCVRVGNCGGEEYGKELAFGMLSSPQDKAILCMEEIALAEAARASEQDRPGWLCLAENISQWLRKKAYVIQDKYDNGGQEPVWLEWDWLMQFKRFREQYTIIIQPEYLFSPAAQATLTSVLDKDGTFTGSGRAFDHISLPWEKLRGHAFQNRSLTVSLPVFLIRYDPRWPHIMPDGLQAAVANVTILTLAAGETYVNSGGNKQVCIRRVAFFVHDGFEFEGDQPLGWWDCKNLQFSISTGIELSNRDFRNFRERTGYGCDFRIMSHPSLVWEGSYCYDIH